ncbi:hydrogenase-4 component B [Peptococcaceae bacterium CEB3]|nr:hydrogenase-4 component B [Peptococcaceae bacterium CEB3]
MISQATLFWLTTSAFPIVGALTFIVGSRKPRPAGIDDFSNPRAKPFETRQAAVRSQISARVGWLLLAFVCLLDLLPAAGTLLSGKTLYLGQVNGLPPLGAWPWQLDSLGSLFLILLGLTGFWVCLYSAGRVSSGQIGTGPSAVAMVGLQFFFTNALLTAQNAFPLLIAWEGMSLAAFAYILVDHTRRQVRRAAYMTVVISELGFLALVIALLLPSHSLMALDFPGLRQALRDSGPGIRLAFFWLTFLRFGVKSGILPVQLWLPTAYTVTPANLGALLAGGLVNLGLFGILRVYFSLLGGLNDGSAFLLVLLGALAGFFGTFYAAVVRDLRRILGYSSIENIGFMVVSFGLAILYFNHAEPAYAGLALVALFLQMISHTLAKSLAFLGSGEIQTLTGAGSRPRLYGLSPPLPLSLHRAPAGAFFPNRCRQTFPAGPLEQGQPLGFDWDKRSGRLFPHCHS